MNGKEDNLVYYVNKDVKDCVRIFPEQCRGDYHRFDMNENPEGLPKGFVDAVLNEITPEFLAIYPEPDRFVHKYADYIGASYENIITTNGSDMAIRYLMEIFCEKGKEVLTVTPSFEMYGVNCRILGLKHKAISYEEDLSLCVDKIVAAITKETDIVVLLNPNNPVGNAYSESDVERIIARAEECNAIVIIDEAYYYFYKKTFLPYALNGNNVAILRTFSKLFSMAACRLGIIIANPKIIEYVRKSRLTFDVNALALLFAERLMDNPDVIEKLVKIADEGKRYTIDILRKNKYEFKDCNGNYILIKPHMESKLLEQELRDKEKILIKTYSNPLLKPYIRVSTGSITAMRFFCEKFLEMDGKYLSTVG